MAVGNKVAVAVCGIGIEVSVDGTVVKVSVGGTGEGAVIEVVFVHPTIRTDTIAALVIILE